MSAPDARPVEPAPAPLSPAQDRLAALPWWRRPRRLRRQLATALVATALIAVGTFGGLNYVAARNLLADGTEGLLSAAGAAQAVQIEAGAERLIAETSVMSASPAIARAVETFTEEFAALGTRKLTAAQQDELRSWYRERVIDPVAELPGQLDASDTVPTTPAAEWLQYHYTVRPEGAPAPVDAGDGTGYTRANVRHADTFDLLSDARGGGDVLLIDSAGTVVFSVDKGIDVGTNLATGPYAQTALGQVITDSLPRARVGTTLLTDFSLTPGGQAGLFAVSAVRNGPRLVGAIAVEIPIALLNAITAIDDPTSQADSYIVSSDRLLQSEPRAWIEDPEGYLARLRAGDEADQAEADLIAFVGSPVGIQTIDTRPVQEALDGEDFDGAARSYAGDPSYTAARAFSPGGRQWVVVTEVPRSAVGAPLRQYLVRILVVLAIILPIVAALGIWLSRLFTRPIRPTVEAARAIVDGDRDPAVDTARRDEFGDLGRRLSAMAGSLAAHEAELADEYDRTRQLLLAVLPPQLVDADGHVVGTGEAVEPATAVAVILAPADAREDQEILREGLGRAGGLAEEIAAEVGLERVRVAADRALYLAGLGTDEPGADAAMEFVAQLRRRLPAEAAEVSLDMHAGLATGMVATGVFDTGSLTFGAWGEPVRRALALASLARVDAVLVDVSTQRAIMSDRWPLVEAHDVVGLDDEPMELFALSDPGVPG